MMRLTVLSIFIFWGCRSENSPVNDKNITLITLDPGHFHAALVQKSMYKEINPSVFIYAPIGADLQLHLERINTFNNRPENPTAWQTEVYSGADFFEKMLTEKKGNVVVLSGNNKKKTEYIYKAVNAGFHVYADKPMAINSEDFNLLQKAFKTAAENNLLIYDIMTERFEIATMLQKEISKLPGIFGDLQNGTVDNPAVTKESIHHFYKYVSGNVLTRPAWFFDTEQEGEGIVDVTTHLVDLIHWECFPGQIINYDTDIELISAKRWTTDLTLAEFSAVTRQNNFPDYLQKNVENSVLKVFSNGSFNYKIKGVHARVSVSWAYKAVEGAGDTHYSIMRGTKSNLVIRQGTEQNFIPTLYIEAVENATISEAEFTNIQLKYPGVELQQDGKGYRVIIPEEYHVGHEAHFTEVTKKFIEYLLNNSMPEWEVPNMTAKYYLTTKALQMAGKN
jgi:predicted dehydrogenase